jgi:hypothetical protein
VYVLLRGEKAIFLWYDWEEEFFGCCRQLKKCIGKVRDSGCIDLGGKTLCVCIIEGGKGYLCLV